MFVACFTSMLIASEVRLVTSHGYLAKPVSKNTGSEETYKLGDNDRFRISAWWLDRAYLDQDRAKTPWTRPGHFDWREARDLIDGYPQTFHPCGCYSPGGPAYCAGVKLASGFGETTTGAVGNGVGPQILPPQWLKGSEQETSFSLYANHAGGYIYMLCKKNTFDSCRDDHLASDIASSSRAQIDTYLKCVWDCFESNVLEFVDGSQKLQVGDHSDLYAKIYAVNKSEGTHPSGSLWRKSPIPDHRQVELGLEGRCAWDTVESFSANEVKEAFERDFGPPSGCDTGPAAHNPKNWHVKDKVKVPVSVPPGEYLLSWRWECGVADQLWTNCADVEIVDNLEPTPPPPPTPPTPTPPAPPTLCTDNVGDHPGALPSAWLPEWAGGGILSCDAFKKLGEDCMTYCQYDAIKKACCFCGGGSSAPAEPEPEPETATILAGGVQVLDGGSGKYPPSTCVQDGSQTKIGNKLIAAQCCDVHGACRRFVGSNDAAGCIAGLGPDIVATTYAEAALKCTEKGLEMCDKSCSGQGCGYNAFPVWTKKPCEASSGLLATEASQRIGAKKSPGRQQQFLGNALIQNGTLVHKKANEAEDNAEL